MPQKCSARGKTKLLDFFIGTSVIKSWEKSRIFKYRFPEYFLSNGQKTKGGGRKAHGSTVAISEVYYYA